MSRQCRAALGLVAVLFATSGCGESAGSTKPLTRSELIARGDAICRRINAQLNAIRSAKDYARLGAYEQAAVVEMRRLTPPSSMASDWGQVVSGAQARADATAKIGTYPPEGAFATRKPAVRAAYAAAGTGMQQMVTAARREGFKDCART
jgi:hypothetical protein